MPYESSTFNPDVEGAARETADSMMERAKTRGTAAVEDSVDWVRRHPAATIALSVAAGAALGALIASGLARPRPVRWPDRLRAYGETLGEGGAEAWEQVKERATHAIDSLRAALQRARS